MFVHVKEYELRGKLLKKNVFYVVANIQKLLELPDILKHSFDVRVSFHLLCVILVVQTKRLTQCQCMAMVFYCWNRPKVCELITYAFRPL